MFIEFEIREKMRQAEIGSSFRRPSDEDVVVGGCRKPTDARQSLADPQKAMTAAKTGGVA